MLKKLCKAVLVLLCIVLLAALALVGYLTVAEYRPADVESAAVRENPVRPGAAQALTAEKAAEGITVLSWNIGYGDLGASSDFFMDGGTHTSNETAGFNFPHIVELLNNDTDWDFALLQEVDSGSTRSKGVDDEYKRLSYLAANSSYALNYSCAFVPFPWPPIGAVKSGLCTLSDLTLASAERVALPCPFSWPVSTANLKRCLLVNRIPIEGSDRELVLIDLHLEAYDDGQGKAAQTVKLRRLVEAEYAKGNYVIAGGDFNQSFPDALEAYPIRDAEKWTPGLLTQADLGDGWLFAYDVSVPSCRLLDAPYDPATTQHFVIDGFLLSPNVTLESVETLNEGFRYSDHNPVLLKVKLE